MSFVYPYMLILLIGVAVFYLVMDIAFALRDNGMPWWVKYVVAVVIFAITFGIEFYIAGFFR